MCERVDQAHIKRAFQTRIEEHIPTGSLCHEFRAHVLCLCMCPEFGGRLGKPRRSEFFFQLGRNSFSVILTRPALLYISSAHVRILREEDVNEMWIAPKKSTKLPFDPIIVIAGRSQMMSLLTDHSHSRPLGPPSDIFHDIIDPFCTSKRVLQNLAVLFQRFLGCLLFTRAFFRVRSSTSPHPLEKRLDYYFKRTYRRPNDHYSSVRR